MYNTRLYYLREYNDLYQKDVGKILGIGQKTYSLYEKGSKFIPLKHLNTLANYYNVSIDYILGLSNLKKYEYSTLIQKIDKVIVGNNIRLIREEKHLSTRMLAEFLNTSPSTISYYEQGKTLILTAFLYQICEKYNYSIDFVIGRTKIKYRDKVIN